MMIRLIGAGMTLLAGGGYAMVIGTEHRKKEGYYEQLLLILEHFSWQLQTNMAPLPVCCTSAAVCGRGKIAELFVHLSQQLESGGADSAAVCMAGCIAEFDLPSQLTQRLEQLGDTLGRYDLTSQIAGIQTVMELCKRDLQALMAERIKSVKSCQALGMCTGAAVAILLL